MRVAYDATKIDDFGIGVYLRNLVGAAALLHPEWEFILLGPPADHAVSAFPNVRCIACRGGGYGPLGIATLSAAARAVAADVFHSPHYVTPIGLDVPLVVTVHDCIHLRFPAFMPRPLGVLPRGLSRRYAKLLLRRVPRVADRIIAVSAATAGDIVDLMDGNGENIDVIHNGVAHFWSELAPPPIVDRPQQLLWVGNPKPHKGLDTLLAAFALLAERDTEVGLTLVGSPDLGRVAAGHPAADRIHTPGFVSDDELRQLYREARAFCFPSLYEGFGLPVLEAMAAGAPVVAAASGAIPEVAGPAARLCRSGDAPALAAALAEVTGDTELSESMVVAGRSHASHFTWIESARRTCEAYITARGGQP
jgi:glycosyltransferase involved in cell wall biosynthesis